MSFISSKDDFAQLGQARDSVTTNLLGLKVSSCCCLFVNGPGLHVSSGTARAMLRNHVSKISK